MATHSSVPAWRIPGTAEPDGLQSMGSHRVGHDWSDLAATAVERRSRKVLGKCYDKDKQWSPLRFLQCLGVYGNSFVKVKAFYRETVSLVCVSWYRKHIISIHGYMYIMGMNIVYIFFILIYNRNIFFGYRMKKFLLFVLKSFKTSVCEYSNTNFK